MERNATALKKIADIGLLLAALGCVALMAARVVSAIRFGPYVFTSGAEAESLFSIWKWINKQTVYPDAFQPPFAQSYFNWLYYWVYGALTSAVLSLSKLTSSDLPAVVRCVTLAFTGFCMFFAYRILSPLSLTRRLAGSAILAFNPLMGFWCVTARPDTGALAFALAGLWCAGKAERVRSSMIWMVMTFVAFYCAWAFKQVYVAAFAAMVLHLFLAGKRRRALWFAAAGILAIALTLIVGTPEYRYAAVLSQSHLEMSVSDAGHYLVRAMAKAPLFPLGVASAIACLRRDRANLMALWALISLPLMFAASAKSGAAENYFFEPAAICSILFLLSGRRIAVASLAQFASPVLIATGLAGVLFALPVPGYALLKSHLAGMNGSVIVSQGGANLPWFQARPPYFVLASTYDRDMKRGKPFAFGGVAGMVRMGLIDYFVCPLDEVNLPYEGIVPSSLRRIGEDSSWAYFAVRPAR